jgi:hypothetical protein
MDAAMLRELVTSQLGREPTDEEMAKISSAMGAVQSGSVQLTPEQNAQAMSYAQGRMAAPTQDPGTVNYSAAPSWSQNAPGRAGSVGPALQYDWDGAGPGDYQTAEAGRAKMFAAQNAAPATGPAAVDAHVNAAWQTGMTAQGKAEAPPYSAMQQDIEKKKAFVAGVQAANGGLGQYAVKNAGQDIKDLDAATKKAAADGAALQKDATSGDAKPAAAQSQGKAKGAEESAATEDDKPQPPAPKPASYPNWNTATPAAKQEAWAGASKQEKKSLTGGEFQLKAQKEEAAKPKFDPKAGTFSNIPVDPAPKAQVMTGVEAPSKGAVEEQLGMSITPSQYKQWLKSNGF